MTPWTLHFDGLCEPTNPGGVMAYGWALVREGAETKAGKGAIPAAPENTNNVAEYLALFRGLTGTAELLRGVPPAEYAGLVIRGDSKLVVEQIDGKWNINAPRLVTAHAACLELLNLTFLPRGPWGIEWVPRDENKVADQLSRFAYTQLTGKVPPERVKRRSA